MPDRQEIEKHRSPKNLVTPDVPYRFLHEQEPDKDGHLRKVNTIFLTSKECSFRCVMCDLWKNTLDGPTPLGAILKQLDYALARLPDAEVIKLYNSGNFFDPGATPPSDYPGIIDRLRPFRRVIVENHPLLCGDSCIDFAGKLSGTLEIAMGLETLHPEVLPKLNKQLTPENFTKATALLKEHGIDVRAFVLLHPPFLTSSRENLEWTHKTIQFAFESGADCCTIIPTRSGNGIMELLHNQGHYKPATLDTLEEVFDQALTLHKGRVFADTWDLSLLSQCAGCYEARKIRLETMNTSQKTLPRVTCNFNSGHAK